MPFLAFSSRCFQYLSNSFSTALKNFFAFGSEYSSIPAKFFIHWKRTIDSASSKNSFVIRSLVDFLSFKSSSMASSSPKSYMVFFPRLEKSVLMSFIKTAPLSIIYLFLVLPRLVKSPYKIYFQNIPLFMRVRKRFDAKKIRKIGWNLDFWAIFSEPWCYRSGYGFPGIPCQ